jgi:tetratricopeptide (TPR) repeat protein
VKYNERNLQQALHWSLQAAKTFELERDKRFHGIALLEAGFCNFKLGDADNAAAAATTALKLFIEIADKRGNVHAINLLAHAYVLIQQFQLALEKVKEALAIARYIDRQPLIEMQLDTMVWIFSVKKIHEDDVARQTRDLDDIQGRWRLKTGEEIATITGKIIIWADGNTVSPLIVSSGGKLSCILEGDTCLGQLDKNGDILWDDGEQWSRFANPVSLEGSVPLQQGAASQQFSALEEKNTQTSTSGARSEDWNSDDEDENCNTLEGALKLRRKIVLKDAVNRLCSLLQSIGSGVESTSLTPLLDTPIAALGLTSTQLFIVRHFMNQHFEEPLPITVLFELPTIGALAAFLVGADVGHMGTAEGRHVADQSNEAGGQPIVSSKRQAWSDAPEMHEQQQESHKHIQRVRRFRAVRALRTGDRMLQFATSG